MAQPLINDYTKNSISEIDSDAQNLIRVMSTFVINFKKDSDSLRRRESNLITKIQLLSLGSPLNAPTSEYTQIKDKKSLDQSLSKTDDSDTPSDAGKITPEIPSILGKNLPKAIPPVTSTDGKSQPDGSNGKLKDNQLKSVGDGHRLWIPAANAYLSMKEAARRDGVNFILSDGYRDYAGQVEMKQKYGKDAAEPGTSLHGWGKAIDISSPGAQEWIVKNGRKYGWIRPSWASWSYEPWHFEYIGNTSSSNVEVQRKSERLISENTSNPSNFQPILVGQTNSNKKIIRKLNSPASSVSLNNNTRNDMVNLYMHTTYGVG